ncbi:amidohydrolase [Microbacterium natoriense]|uniref:amidohydrolase n=1 Tax=Microbacterium natoriense TaxID=284570 RepID=UPI0031DF8644
MIDTIIVAARVRALAPESTETIDGVDAVAITAGRISAIGPRSEVLPLAGSATELITHPHATIIPGLVDAHSHPVYSLGIVRGLSLTGVHTYAELIAALERGREEQAGEEWFLAWGLDPTAFEGRPIGNAALHEVLGADRPAYIKMFDAHSGIASASALSRAGIDRPVTHPDGSGAAGDADGALTGHLIEFPTMEIVERVLPVQGFDDRVVQLRRLLSDMAAVGITSAHVMDLQDDDALDLLAAIEADGELPVRLRISPWVTPDTTDLEAAELIAMQGVGGRRYRIGGVKFFIDGTVEGGTAWLSSPDSEGEGLSSTWVPAEAYAERIRLFDREGVPTATHAIGDRGIRFAAETLASLPAGGVPHRIEHIESVEDDVIDLIGCSGIMASMQPTHCTHHMRADHSDDWSRRLGPERASRGWRTADVRRSGATLALGSDWPVADFDPWEIMADAQLRRSVAVLGSPVVGAAQGLTATEALEGYTTHAHRSVGSADGALVVGSPADLIVIDRDPLACTPEELLQTHVLLTLVDGVPTHAAS